MWLPLIIQNAEALSSFLNAHGIDAQAQDERCLQRWWFMAQPWAGVHVRVPQEKLARAEHCLQAFPEAVQLLASAIRCPECKSIRVNYPAITRENILPALVAQTAVLLGVIEHESYCESYSDRYCESYCERCQYTWPQKGLWSASKPEPAAALCSTASF